MLTQLLLGKNPIGARIAVFMAAAALTAIVLAAYHALTGLPIA